MRALLDSLPSTVRSTLGDVWEDLQSGTSDEARFVKQVDRLETFLQARHYQRDDPRIPVESFRCEVMETIDDPLLRAIRDAALAGAPDQDDG
jgi:putative hydrolase of HD superfamily